ncbi:MAG: trehalose-phosphatase [Sumerlaeia bacterium]
MKPLSEAEELRLQQFFEKLAASKTRLLLLDYDGTLAPFQERRDQAFPAPGVREAVQAILRQGRTRVAVISGRAIADLRPLLGIEPPPEMWGSHGREHLTPDGHYETLDLTPAAEAGLTSAEKWALERDLHPHIERKPGCIAIHWRSMNDGERQQFPAAAKTAWSALTRPATLELHEFDGGLELRVPGRNKGDAVRAILDNMDLDGLTCAFLGDDLTDEDAFAVLRPLGQLCVLVRPEHRSTLATVWIRPYDDLLEFLYRWKESIAD